MRKFNIFFNITIVLLFILPLGTAFSMQAAGYAVQPDMADEAILFNENDPDQPQNGLEPEGGIGGDGVRWSTMAESHVRFDPFKGGDYFFKDNQTGEFCFTAETFTGSGFSGTFRNIWLKFPTNWSILDGKLIGDPVCDRESTWGSVSFQLGNDGEIRINHHRTQGSANRCEATYCLKIKPFPKALQPYPVSWYMDYREQVDQFPVIEKGMCSVDGYTPPGSPACEFNQPIAYIPASVDAYSSWERIANLPAPARNRPAAVALGGKIYLIGGETTGDGGRADRVAILDPERNTWSVSNAKMPFPARNICAVTYKHEIFVIGGSDSNNEYLDKIQIYNPRYDEWREWEKKLVGPVSGAGCAILDSTLFVFGGHKPNGAYITDGHSLDFTSSPIRWRYMAKMNSPARGYMASTVMGGFIYAIGGRSSNAPDIARVEVYNPYKDKWDEIRDLNIPRNAPGAYSIDNDLIVCGGGDSIHHNTCEILGSRFGNQYWVYLQRPMQTARRTFAYATLGMDLYAIGGWNNGRLISAERMVNTPSRLTLTKVGQGTVTSSPAGINCGTTCAADFAHNTVVTLTATPADGWYFSGWGGECTGSGTCQVTMSQARSVTATFERVASLKVNIEGQGKVISNPAGIDCVDSCVADYIPNTQVTLTATPAAGWTFSGWGGDCTGTGTCSVTMSQSRSVTATFIKGYVLEVIVNGKGLITSSPAGINCEDYCGAWFDANTVVTLSATPEPGWYFAGWSGDCAGTGMCTVTMSQARSVKVNFTQDPDLLTVNIVGQGTVTSNPAGIDCHNDPVGVPAPVCLANFAHNTEVTLTATAVAGWTFTGWSGDCGGAGTCQVTMSEARSVTATFIQDTYQLTVTKVGQGTVTSSPSGINCGVTCEADFAYNTVVTLTAAPAAGWTFSGWSGDCSGTGTCTVTMTADRSVTATFISGPPPPPPPPPPPTTDFKIYLPLITR